MRIVYSGAVVSNGGDAAIMDAQIALLGDAFPDQRVVLHDNAPAVAQRLYPNAEVLLPLFKVVHRPAGKRFHERALRKLNERRVLLAARAWRRLGPAVGRRLLTASEAPQVASLAAADLVAYTGGTTLIERYSVHGKTYELNVAARLGRPIVMLPASLGPFLKPRNQESIRSVAQDAALILLRDPKSLRHLEEIAAHTNRAKVVPDVVFALGTDEGEQRLAAGTLPPAPTVAISVRDIAPFVDGPNRGAGQAVFEQAVADFVMTLTEQHGAKVTFLSTCQGTPEYWTDDSRVADSIRDLLPTRVRDKVVVDHEYRDFDALAAAYASFDLAVCTRMHAGIIALGVGTPVLPIAYEFKTQQVMDALGLGAYVVPTDGITGPALAAAFDALTRDLPERRPHVAEALGWSRQQLRDLVPTLRAAVA